jgi:hypothetical protein
VRGPLRELLDANSQKDVKGRGAFTASYASPNSLPEASSPQPAMCGTGGRRFWKCLTASALGRTRRRSGSTVGDFAEWVGD